MKKNEMLIDKYIKNRGKKKIFSEIISIDWYDGAATGLLKLNTSEEWYVFNLSYFDTKNSQRFFTLISASDQWVTKFKSNMEKNGKSNLTGYKDLMKEIKEAFNNYKGDVYLMKTLYMEDINYEITKIPFTYLMYNDNVEKAFDQNDSSLERFKAFF